MGQRNHRIPKKLPLLSHIGFCSTSPRALHPAGPRAGLSALLPFGHGVKAGEQHAVCQGRQFALPIRRERRKINAAQVALAVLASGKVSIGVGGTGLYSFTPSTRPLALLTRIPWMWGNPTSLACETHPRGLPIHLLTLGTARPGKVMLQWWPQLCPPRPQPIWGCSCRDVGP